MKKGPLAEAAVVAYLREQGFTHAERRLQGGRADRGDIAGVRGITIEVKNEQRMSLSEWLDEAIREARAEDELPVVWHKRVGRSSPGEWYVTMEGQSFAGLISGLRTDAGMDGPTVRKGIEVMLGMYEDGRLTRDGLLDAICILQDAR